MYQYFKRQVGRVEN